jgi:phosphatidylglycerophosphatase A
MKRTLTSCFGLGRLPLAPGTYGSMPPALIFALMCYWDVKALCMSGVLAVLALIGSFVCVRFAPATIAATGDDDPNEIVADEFAGQALTFLPVALFVALSTFSTRQLWLTTVLGFLLFRVFDVIKPWPIHKLEKLPKGWGILMDDLVAGLYAAIILLICVRLWIVR